MACTYSFMPVCSQMYWLQTVALYSLPDTWEEQRKLPNGRERPRGPPSIWWYSPQLMRQGWFWFVITKIVTALSARFACFYIVLSNLLSMSRTVCSFILFIYFFSFPFKWSPGSNPWIGFPQRGTWLFFVPSAHKVVQVQSWCFLCFQELCFFSLLRMSFLSVSTGLSYSWYYTLYLTCTRDWWGKKQS